MSIYEQLNPRHMHRYTGYPYSYLEEKNNPMEGVTISNNGFWTPSYPDEEFKFEPGNGLLNKESLEEFLRGVRVEIPQEERQVTFTTGEAGRRAMEEAFENYLRAETRVLIQPRRRGRSAAQEMWNRLREEQSMEDTADYLVGFDPALSELPDSVTVTREFRTEQEAIAYLDSLSETTDTEYEENTDIV